MTLSDLHKLLPRLQTKKFLCLNDFQLIAYSRIYGSIYNLVFVNGLDGEYGDRKSYYDKLETLSNMMIRRVANRKSLTDKARLIYAAFHVLYNNALMVDRAKEAQCMKLMSEVVDEYLARPSEDYYQTFWVMRLMVLQMYGYIEEGTQMPVQLDFVRERLAQWNAELNEETLVWDGLSIREALFRLMLFAMNSVMLLDRQYHDRISQTFNHYVSCLEEEDYRMRAIAFDIMLLREPSTHENLEQMERITRLRIHPDQDPDLVFRALQVQHICGRGI